MPLNFRMNCGGKGKCKKMFSPETPGKSDIDCNMGAGQSATDPDTMENQTITFVINSKSYTVSTKTLDNDISPEYKLVDFIRYKAGLKGTKYMCKEGGCGACVVTVRTKDSAGQDVVRAVNSCLVPIFSCDGWDISTVESLGNKKTGYSAVQQRLVKFGGTQCGFCSPGMVMNMNSLLESKPSLKTKEIENSFDGNICRCTGYRPILDAFKSFASDAPEELKRKCCDIEDLRCTDCPSRTQESMAVPASLKSITFKDGRIWVTAMTLSDAFEAIKKCEEEGLSFRIVGGNTATGIYKKETDGIQAFINITNIPELNKVTINTSGVSIGGGVTLTRGITSLKKASGLPGFQYTNGIAKHWERIANTPVRNVATIAGNLMIKWGHAEFPSDLFLTLEAVEAELSIASSPTEIVQMTPLEFLKTSMKSKLILSINLKELTSNHIYKSFKISRRFQNAHAYVNAAFCMRVDKTANYTVTENPNIVYGGINNDFVHASLTEKFLTNKSLRDPAVLSGAMQTLDRELKPDSRPPDGSVAYRKRLAQNLLYKTILWILGLEASPKVRSGGKNLKRNITRGEQTYETDKTTWPINQPILKLESLPQVSGEAEYINDITEKHGELFGAFVLSTVATAEVREIDASEAEMLPGVVKFIKASDIPGLNNYMVFAQNPEEIFADSKVRYLGQPLGLVVAESRDIAFKATELVKVTFANVAKGITSIEEAVEALKYEEKNIEATALSEDIEKTAAPEESQPVSGTRKIVGEFQIGSQYHFQMETHVTICVPTEDSMDVYSSTQWMDLTQSAIAVALGIPCHEVNLSVRRLGGAYGCKITRATQIACACAVAAHVLNRPVRVALDLETNMKMVGKRAPFLMKYEVDVDDGGKILAMKGKIFCNTGNQSGEETADAALGYMQSFYEANNWKVTPINVGTNTPSNTWTRAPGTTPGIALIENIMEHIAFTLKKDPVAVRLANVMKPGDTLVAASEDEKFTGENLIPRMLEELKISGKIDDRKRFIEDFNNSNRWKKRGMALVPMRYPLEYFGSPRYPAFVSIYRNDGTVAVSTGGIECGQGLNTKVAQAVAYEFGIPMEKVKVKPSNNLVSPNADSTGGSVSSELCVFAALRCCQILNEKMKPLKDRFKNITWEALVTLCYNAGMHLVAAYMPGPEDKLNDYDIWVVNLTEVEIDCLTGESKIVRVDLIEDAGKSLNPEVDIGQVEGALTMGLGYWTTEKLVYGSDPLSLLTHNTWTYKPPLPKDIAEDLRITLLKNAPNPIGILRSKATGEPPLCSSVCVLFALKNAIYAARKDAGNLDWFRLDGPVTPEDILLKSLTSPNQFTL